MRSSTRTQGPNYLSPAFYLGRAITAVVDYVAKKNKGPDARILDSIVVDFKRGILCGTAGMPAEILTEHEAATAWERRDFFREGYALGLAALHALTFSRGNPERRNRHPHNFRIMHYTGYGVWNAFAGMVGLPRISNEQQIEPRPRQHGTAAAAPSGFAGRATLMRSYRCCDCIRRQRPRLLWDS